MLRSIETIKPGTVSFSVRGDARGSGNARDGPISPRRVRADVAVPAGTAQGTAGMTPGTVGGSTPASGTSLADAFRAAMVRLVGAHHDAFLARLGDDAANDEEGPVIVNGQVVEWHPKFDLESCPDPPSGPPRQRRLRPSSRTRGSAASKADVAEHPRVGNGSAMPANWGRANLDSGDVKARAIAARGVTDEEAAAAAAALGDAGGELPLAAVAAVMKRKAAADHDADPATIAERRRRRLCDILPSLFDTTLFAVRDVQEEGVDLRGSAPTRPPHHHAAEFEPDGGGGGVAVTCGVIARVVRADAGVGDGQRGGALETQDGGRGGDALRSAETRRDEGG